jgi:hypothetical protein
MLKVQQPGKDSRHVEDALTEALLRELQGVPTLEVRVVRTNLRVAGREIDVSVEVGLPGMSQLLLIGEIKQSGEPRFARAVVDRLFYLTNRTFPGSYGVFLAPYVSPEAAAICEAESFGYLDLAGNCLLKLGHNYIRREGRPNVTAQKRLLRSFYSPKAERILRALLTEPCRSWKLQELAAAANVSLGQAHNVKTLLHDREWLTAGPNGLQLREPGKLLDEWAGNYDFSRSVKHNFHSLRPCRETEELIGALGTSERIRYAFTGFSAAARIAPHTRYQRVHAYVDPERVLTMAEAADLKRVATGANVVLLTPYDEGVYYNTQDEGHSVVSPVQLYLDLRALAGRGEDAAEFLLETVLQRQW